MLPLHKIQAFYFLGIGGIGMSALARYFHSRGFLVAGYDRTPSALTAELESEGISISYEDNIAGTNIEGLSPDTCQVVYTPAVPRDTNVYTYFSSNGFDILKRSEVLGLVTRQMQALCVAGTHGKTTTSTMIAHIMHQSHLGANAFLGGISNNYHSNLLIAPASQFVAVEADEYDRSFHRLTPYISVITSADPDHLDIYGDAASYREAFEHYTSLITHALVIKAGIAVHPHLQDGVEAYTYGTPQADFHPEAIRCLSGEITFDLAVSKRVKEQGINDIHNISLGAPVWVNIENSVAAMAVCLLAGATPDEVRSGIATYAGVYRRFDRHVKTDHVVYFDDYAHHPEELRASIASISRLYPDRKLVGVFQPHLYTRTRDFADQFAEVLSTLDELILLPIYPARELPIKGVNSEMLLDRVRAIAQTSAHAAKVRIVEKSELVETLQAIVNNSEEPMALITLGAGDIDRLVTPITEMLLGAS